MTRVLGIIKAAAREAIPLYFRPVIIVWDWLEGITNRLAQDKRELDQETAQKVFLSAIENLNQRERELIISRWWDVLTLEELAGRYDNTTPQAISEKSKVIKKQLLTALESAK